MKMFRNTLILSLVLGMAVPAQAFSVPAIASQAMQWLGGLAASACSGTASVARKNLPIVAGHARKGLGIAASFARQNIRFQTQTHPEIALALAAATGVATYHFGYKAYNCAKDNLATATNKLKAAGYLTAFGSVLAGACVGLGMNQ